MFPPECLGNAFWEASASHAAVSFFTQSIPESHQIWRCGVPTNWRLPLSRVPSPRPMRVSDPASSKATKEIFVHIGNKTLPYWFRGRVISQISLLRHFARVNKLVASNINPCAVWLAERSGGTTWIIPPVKQWEGYELFRAYVPERVPLERFDNRCSDQNISTGF